MKSFVFLALFLLGIQFSGMAQTASDNASGLSWYTDLTKARAASDASHKPIFGFFTGSDWCGWCRKLQSDVFAKDAFVAWAKKNVILLELDFPRRKQLPAELAQQNQALQQALNIQGYPTIWFFTVTEDNTTHMLSLNTLGSLGYPQGAEVGKEEVKFLIDANVILAKGKK
ncbi:MAG: thioredoxin family protein [Phycisphaerae bacterium]|nr:thioredoxin family protein [Saprospiraceae bacterium]